MRYWIRTTHDFNNETREWEFRESLNPMLQVDTQSICGVHAVPRDHWATLLEIAEENRIYYEQWRNHPFSGCNSDLNSISQDVLLKDLEILEQLGLVKSKVIQ